MEDGSWLCAAGHMLERCEVHGMMRFGAPEGVGDGGHGVPVSAVEGAALDDGGDRRTVLAQAPAGALGGELGAAQQDERVGADDGDTATQTPAQSLVLVVMQR